mmetsp:Transcript_9866/g.14546  ORF Transcript_9866/g.14546 Transcript_9866/m.14546 type:complete len:565 (-) Transcript_9866:7-1701(-)
MVDAQGKTAYVKFGNTEYKVELLPSTQYCKFTWIIRVYVTQSEIKELYIPLPVHSRIVKKHKRITPKKLFNMVRDAFFDKNDRLTTFKYFFTTKHLTLEDQLDVFMQSKNKDDSSQVPQTPADHLVITVTLHSKYEDDKRFDFILKPKEKGEPLSTISKATKDQYMTSLERRVRTLETDNAQLRAAVEILKKQNMEIQDDMKQFHKTLMVLTENHISKNKLTHKEWTTIAKSLFTSNKVNENVLHHIEGLSGAIRNMTPKQSHSIYKAFKNMVTNVSKPALVLRALDAKREEDPLSVGIAQAWILATCQKKTEKAIELLSQLIEAQSTTRKLAFAYFSRGRLLDDPNAELHDYNMCLRANPTFFAAYLNRANLYQYKLNDPQQACHDYTMAIQYDPTDFAVYYNRAGLYFKFLEEPLLALEDYKKSIQLNAAYAHSYNNIALLYKTKFNDPIKALKSYDLAIKYEPTYYALYLNRASLKFEKLDAPEEALHDYNKAIELNVGYADAYVGRGNVYLKLGLEEEARLDFRKALKLDKNNVAAARALQTKVTHMHSSQQPHHDTDVL